MIDQSNLRILSFPVDDDALRGEVERALASLPSNGLTPAALEAALRHCYRSVQVRARNPLGGYADEPSLVWYVYRDGRIRRPNESLDRVYAILAAARVTRRSSEALLGAARQTARRASQSLSGRRPEAGPDEGIDFEPAAATNGQRARDAVPDRDRRGSDGGIPG
jgi:hypothetical protein